MHGYIGAHPRPMIKNPAIAIATLSAGIATKTTPTASTDAPMAIILRSPSLSVTKPDASRPAVMPM